MKNNIIKKTLYPFVLLKRKVMSAYYSHLGKTNIQRLLDIRYYDHFKRKMDWDNPQTLNEKILWLKLYSDTSLWTMLADKYQAREYIKKLGYEHILVKLYGKWDDATSIDWDNLPKKFVMKVNNGSGDVLVCKDKSKLNLKKETSKFKKLLKKPFGYSTGEPHYIDIKPCIIAEELLDCSKQAIDTDTLIDYKIWCFDGRPECIWACYNRHKDSVEVAVYDLDWNIHPEYSIFTDHYIRAKQILPKPESLNEMLKIASDLSKGFPEVRIDLYEVDGKVYFGEYTFSSNYGMMDFYTEEYQKYLGSLCKI